MNDNGRIPFRDLVTAHQELKQEVVAVVGTALHAAGLLSLPRYPRSSHPSRNKLLKYCGAYLKEKLSPEEIPISGQP